MTIRDDWKKEINVELVLSIVLLIIFVIARYFYLKEETDASDKKLLLQTIPSILVVCLTGFIPLVLLGLSNYLHEKNHNKKN